MSDVLKIIFAGTPEFAAAALQALLQSRHQICAIYTQPDRPAGRGRKLTPGPVKRLALEAQLPLYQPATLKNPRQQEQLHNLDADLMVVVAYGLILPARVLTIPRLGCVNVHASLLPRWRGAAPIQRAILAGDAQTGITIMQMDKGLDTGDILHREPCEIKADDTAASLHDRLARLGAAVLLSTLEQIATNTVTRIRQDERLACYATKISKMEALIDWTRSAVMIERAVRAFNPWPVAYTTLKTGARLRVWQAEAMTVSGTGQTGGLAETAPGTVIAVGRQGIDVATGEGTLRLKYVQPAGGRSMPANDFLNAHPVKNGDLFGQQGNQAEANQDVSPAYSKPAAT